MDNENLNNVIINTAEHQEARAFLRERFLRCISSITGSECDMKTVELTEISGVYHGMDMHVNTMFIKNLVTPFIDVKNSLIRTDDVLFINFPNIGNDNKQFGSRNNTQTLVDEG